MLKFNSIKLTGVRNDRYRKRVTTKHALLNVPQMDMAVNIAPTTVYPVLDSLLISGENSAVALGSKKNMAISFPCCGVN